MLLNLGIHDPNFFVAAVSNSDFSNPIARTSNLNFVAAADFNTVVFDNSAEVTVTDAVADDLTSPILHIQPLSLDDEKELLLLPQISIDNQISACTYTDWTESSRRIMCFNFCSQFLFFLIGVEF